MVRAVMLNPEIVLLDEPSMDQPRFWSEIGFTHHR
jgi:ABC-type transporter Mla maintaining outer membrane lipid asymmetry ATPase subunit MlaF